MSRGGHNSDSKRYYDWLFYANNDLTAANALCEDKRLYGLSAFHCQQCIEKSFKAYLLYKTRKLMDGHNLSWLCKQSALYDEEFKKWLVQVSKLNRLYIEARYPADILVEVDRQTVLQTLELTDEVFGFVCDQMKFDYNSFHRKTKIK